MKSLKLKVIVHNVRSCHNVGSIFRSCDALGAEQLILTGYTPYPENEGDARLPHIAQKLDRQIKKTALGAEKTVSWQFEEDIFKVINEQKESGYKVLALEQSDRSVDIRLYDKRTDKIVLIVGSEIGGIDDEVLTACDGILEIKQAGKKESLNVSVAAAIAMFELTRP